MSALIIILHVYFIVNVFTAGIVFYSCIMDKESTLVKVGSVIVCLLIGSIALVFGFANHIFKRK